MIETTTRSLLPSSLKRMLRLMTAALVLGSIAFSPMSQALDCPAGRLGPGKTNVTSDGMRCFEGIPLRDNEQYCEADSGEGGGKGGVYATDLATCDHGHRVHLGSRHCLKGRVSIGGEYPVQTQYCYEGLRMRLEERFCPSTAGSYKGKPYTPSRGETCPTLGPIKGAGQVQHIAGTVRVTHADGRQIDLRPGDSLAEGDTINTGADGKLIATMKDFSQLELMHQSSLRVDTSRFDEKSCKSTDSCSTVLNFMKGGLRWITSKLTFKEGFKVQAPNAAYGIRGTDFDLYHIEENALPGTYLRVNTGVVFIQSGGREFDVKENQIAVVRKPGAEPELIRTLPYPLTHYR